MPQNSLISTAEYIKLPRTSWGSDIYFFFLGGGGGGGRECSPKT